MLQYAREDFAGVEVRPLELTVVIPTLNEAENIRSIVEKLALALAGIEWEAIFVDDASTDGTPDRVAEAAAFDRRIRLIRRFGRRGLSSAVMEGFLASTAPVVAVMDGDGQHDERILPQLHDAVRDGRCDLAVGTRYSGGGSIGEWSPARARISDFATRLARPLLIKTPLSDPMSGFFAIRREAVLEAVPRLSSVGYKILLDLVASTPRPLAVSEVPYAFRDRASGESKLDGAVALEYLELLLDKAIGRWIPVKLVKFSAVGALGLGIHLVLLSIFLQSADASFTVAQTIAVIGAMTFNFELNNRFTYRDRRLRGAAWAKGLASFYLVCSLGALANIGVGSLAFDSAHDWWVAGLIGALIGSVWNYVASGWLTWSRR
jgi:dolichol-phosphate mannosyltransferase